MAEPVDDNGLPTGEHILLTKFFRWVENRPWPRHIDRAQRHANLERAIFARCRQGHFPLIGKSVDPMSRSAENNPEDIAREFFDRGSDLTFEEDDSKLIRTEANGSRRIYRNVAIERTSARYVAREFKRQEYQDARKQLMEEVRHRRLKPQEAEAKAAEMGLDPLNPPPDPVELDPMKEDFWTFAMAGAWIAWRDIERVRDQWMPWRSQVQVWKCCTTPGVVDPATGKPIVTCHLFPEYFGRPYGSWSDLRLDITVRQSAGAVAVSSKEEVERALWAALQAGKLKADGIDQSTGKRVEIPALEFHDLKCWGKGKQEDHLGRWPKKPSYELPRLPVRDVLRLWPERQVVSTAGAESECYRRLAAAMRDSPDRSERSKPAWYRHLAGEIENLGNPQQQRPSASFERAWTRALTETGASWNSPGRKSTRRNRGPN